MVSREAALLRDPCSCALIWEADKRGREVHIINSHTDTVSHTHIIGMHTCTHNQFPQRDRCASAQVQMLEQMERMREPSHCPKYRQVWNPAEEPDGQLFLFIYIQLSCAFHLGNEGMLRLWPVYVKDK